MSPSRFDNENSASPDPRERELSPAAQRRASLEKLQKASRVKNSNMFARESKDKYDLLSSPVVERPTNSRPWSTQFQSNAFTRYDSLRKENNPLSSPELGLGLDNPKSPPVHRRTESKMELPTSSPTKSQADGTTSPPIRSPPSPMKSSLIANGRFNNSPMGSPQGLGLGFDPENGTWSDEEEQRASTPRGPRHAKSVTFDTAPPELNEYEEQTPEPSSVTSGSVREGSYDSDEYDDPSFERGSSYEQEDSFDASLEDTEKTPVVLPEDWQNMSPDMARTDLVDDYDDVFDGLGSPDSHALPDTPRQDHRDFMRSESFGSDGELRPLPPIPAIGSPGSRGRRDSSGSLTAAVERASSMTRNLPLPPPPAIFSKNDILLMRRNSSMTLEDRLELMALRDSPTVEKPSPLGLGLTGSLESIYTEKADVHVDEEEIDEDELANLPDVEAAPRISRESILRKVKASRFDDVDEDNYDDEASIHSDIRDYADLDLANLDPDVPIPSRETSKNFDEQDAMIIKQEDNDDSINLDAIPSADDQERQSSVIHHDVEREYSVEDTASRYSSPMSQAETEQGVSAPTFDIHSPKSPAFEGAFATPMEDPNKSGTKHMSLPALSSFLSADNDDFGLRSYLTPSPPPEEERKEQPEEQTLEEPRTPSTPGSVVHHSTESEGSFAELELLIVPERKATIKTQGKLRARPSGTPADLQTMINARRVASGETVPPIPDQFQRSASGSTMESETASEHTLSTQADSFVESETSRRESSRKLQLNLDIPVPAAADGLGFDLGQEFDRVIESQKVAFPPPSYARFPTSSQKHTAGNVPLSSSASALNSSYGAAENTGITSFSPQQRTGTNVYTRTQKGYLMRQNTKVVIASNRNFSDENPPPPMSPTFELLPATRGTRSAGNSPRKPSSEKFLTTEPWNGKRRKSTRQSNGRRQSHTAVTSAAPPLPGQESALGVVDEDAVMDGDDEGGERGRLFVKVVGVKDLDLPMPKSKSSSIAVGITGQLTPLDDRLYFQLTLDNGLHCVTTANLELGKSAPIGQEFELVVLQDLEFQLTLTTKLPPPPKQAAPVARPSSPTKSPTKQSALSRLLSSPKKRAERERKAREEAEAEERRLQEEEAKRKRTIAKPTAWDMMHELVDAKTGSFARAYISLKSHESQCFGRQLTVDVPCFNEWALEKDINVVSSVRSKRSNGNFGGFNRDGAIKRPPYPIGKLELQLLYVPKPKGATDDDMPKSMNGAVKEINAAMEVKESKFEGILSQQGGDCPVSIIHTSQS